jgi:hypothetical protein
MLGWINDCVEKLVLEKFGVDAWHTIKLNAGCDVADGAFLKLEHYSDASTINLVTAASEVAGLTVPQVLETFGTFFVHYIRDEGYENLLCCQGSTLRDWCGNINAIHHHLQTTFPKAMTMPLFWVTDGDDNNGSLVLHYHSKRGNLFAPLAKGIVVEIAKFQFGVDIRMDLNELQGENGSDVTSWSVNAVDPSQQWKLTQNDDMRNGKKNAPTALKWYASIYLCLRVRVGFLLCPFSKACSHRSLDLSTLQPLYRHDSAVCRSGRSTQKD